MHATASTTGDARTRPTLRAVLLLVAVAAFLTTTPATARAASAVASASASPPAFVPDWDGHSDSTVLTYRLDARSTVVIRVLDHRGRVVTSMRVGVRDAGTHHATWDGRDERGAVQPPGTYGLRVDARPVPRPASAAGEPGTASMGGTVATAGARAATVTLQRADVVLTGVELSRTAVGARGRSSRTGAGFQLSAPATVSAAIVDAHGGVVRTLTTSRMRAGRNSLAWDGRRSDGTPATDGEYALVLAATSGGRPTDTMRVPLTVDRATPKSSSTKRSTARIDRAGRLRIPITVTTSERSTVVVRSGRRSQRFPVEAGTHRLVVDGARLGLRPVGRTRSVSLLVQVVDGAGNVAATRTNVSIPKRPARAPTPVPPAPKPNPTPPTPTPETGNPLPAVGKWPWPVEGIVTSEFGLRDGRPHTGIDIAAPKGTPIHPVGAGTVSFVGQLGGYGNLVIVEHPSGVRTYYAHMSRFGGFAVGASVSHIDVLGEVGCTGNCTGNHLHFETRTADTPRNPRSFLTAR